MILTILLVAIVWVVGIMFFIKPAIDDVGTAQQELDDAKATLTSLNEQIEADKDLDQRIEEAYAEVTQLTNSFYTYQEAQEATQLIDDLLDTDEITNQDMAISSYGATELKPYTTNLVETLTDMDSMVISYDNQGETADAETETAETDPDKVPPAPVAIGAYNITFSYEVDDFNKIISFCDKLQSSNTEKTIVINELNITTDDKLDGSEIHAPSTGSLSMTMYVIRKLPDPSTF